LGCQTVGEGFSSFLKKIMDGEDVCQTVEDALLKDNGVLIDWCLIFGI
jgi:hypothetical protein